MDDNVPRPRLCHIKKRANFDGYGFNLHAEKMKPGQFIGSVDDASPAQVGGLKHGDKIIEVNGVNICTENHRQVVQRIKAIPDETRLLVVDAECEAYHKENDIVVTGSLPYILRLSSEPEAVEPEKKRGIESPPSYEEEINFTYQAGSEDIIHEDKEDGGHAEVTREDSLLSDRTVSNRSSVSSGKEKDSPVHLVVTPPEPERKFSDLDDASEVAKNPPKVVVDEHEELEYIDADAVSAPTSPAKLETFGAPEPVVQETDSMNYGADRIAVESIQEEADDSSSESETEAGYDVSARKTKTSVSFAETEEVDEEEEEEQSFPAVKAADRRSSSSSSSSDEEEEHIEAEAVGVGKVPNSLSSGSNRSTPSPTNIKDGGLHLPLTAREMREILGSRKKTDPRKGEKMDMKKKFDIIHSL